MKKVIIASVFLLAFTMNAHGQISIADMPPPPPTEWNLNGEPVYPGAALYTTRTTTLLSLLENSKSISRTADNNFKIDLFTGRLIDIEKLVKGDTITYKDILINGKPATVHQQSEFTYRYSVVFPEVFKKWLIFPAISATETPDDFVLIVSGVIDANKGCSLMNTDTRGQVVTTLYTCPIEYKIAGVYVFEKSGKDLVFSYELIGHKSWNREARGNVQP